MDTNLLNPRTYNQLTYDTQHLLKRKAIDNSGRLGSFYDASTDRLVDRYSTSHIRSTKPKERITCRLIPNHKLAHNANFLKYIDCDDSIRQSICFRLVTPSGVCGLVEYDQSLTDKTRLLYYSYKARVDKMSDSTGAVHRVIETPPSGTSITHMITKIIWGFEVLCIIQIPNDQSITDADSVLKCISYHLYNDRLPIQLSNDEKYVFEQLTNVTVYGSEVCVNQLDASITSILTRIRDWQRNSNHHQPLVYWMKPIRLIHNKSFIKKSYTLKYLQHQYIYVAEHTVNRLEQEIIEFMAIFEKFPTSFSSTTLDERLQNAHARYHFILKSKRQLQEQLRTAVVDVRQGSKQPNVLLNILQDQIYECLNQNEMRTFLNDIVQILNTSALVEVLHQHQIEYIDVSDVMISNQILPLTIDDIDCKLKITFCHTGQQVILWYSSDYLKSVEEQSWQNLFQEFIAEHRKAVSKMRLIYVDFSSIEAKLDHFIIVKISSTGIPTTRHIPLTESTAPTNTINESLSPIPTPLVRQPIEINILLLGESSVGKSTFIKAFANYIKFDSFEEAEQDFQIANCFNESDRHHCRSYLIHLNNEFCLRFIDTPGIDKNQNSKPMNNILTYINHLSHLNAICLLFKPDSSHVNVFIRSCIQPLVNYLKSVNHINILFCFTHTQPTFYNCAETDILLRKILKRERLNNIRLTKDNTFCFDNESVGYLYENNHTEHLTEHQRAIFSKSWHMSSEESKSLLNFVKTCKPYYLNECLSLKTATIDTIMLSRPLMETMRLIIYNWKLYTVGNTTQNMTLNLRPITTELCTNCAQANMVDLEQFWLIQYKPPIIQTKANQHSHCLSNGKHILIEYIITHSIVQKPIDLNTDLWQKSLQSLMFKCDRLCYFLRQQDIPNEENPFVSIIERFIEEEHIIFQTRNIDSKRNIMIYDALTSLKQMSEENHKKLLNSKERLSAKQVYQIISELLSIPMIKEQINTLKQSRQLKMKMKEYVLS